MRRYLPYIFCFLLIASISLGVFAVAAHASDATQNSAAGTAPPSMSIFKFFGYGLAELISFVISNVINLALGVMAVVLALAGWFLNIAMNLTLNIKAFVDGTQAIYTTWAAIRDITSMFIIFFLLYAAIQMIIGLENPGFGQLIKNIIVAGVLINFSFFFTGLGIDASNIVSMQLYNAIAPTNSLNSINFEDKGAADQVSHAFGLANIFMQSLQITQVYNTSLAASSAASASSTATAGNAISAPVKIIIMGIVGIVIEFVAACSFALAGAAFIVRFIILLLLLAFSPIWFASFIVPQLKTYKDKWSSAYKSMLLFMPVYLLLMYMAMNVMTTSTVLRNGYQGNLVGSSGIWYDNLLVLGVNAAIIIFLLNAPLVVAISMGGAATSWISKTGLTGSDIWKKVGGVGSWAGRRASGFVATRTVGMAAGKTDKWLSNTRLGNSLLGRDIRGSTTGALAKAKMGASRSYEERMKENKDVMRKGKEIDRSRDLRSTLADMGAGLPPKIDPTTGLAITPGTILGKMNEKEKLSLGFDRLNNVDVLKHLKGSDFEAIKKSEDLTDEQKATINDARTAALQDAVTKGEASNIKNMVDNMDGKDTMKLIGKNPTLAMDPAVIEHLKPSQLKTMAEEGLDDATRRNIGNTINNWIVVSGRAHKAASFVTKNRTDWL